MHPSPRDASTPPAPRHRAFTLVELLVVVSIIALLLGILVPAVNSARRQAKRTKVRAALKAMSGAMEMFRNDIGEYMPSMEVDNQGNPVNDPVVGADTNNPNGAVPIYGAHRLARALVGHDLQGYAKPTGDGTEYQMSDGTPLYPRYGPYLDAEGVRIVYDVPANAPGGYDPYAKYRGMRINFVARRPPDNLRPHAPMFLDVFNYPILYYRANTIGDLMLESMDPQNPGRGRYRHLDNDYFTGTDASSRPVPDGWQYANREHRIRRIGADELPPESSPGAPMPPDTFATYIHDPEVRAATSTTSYGGRIWPYNPDSFLLISAGPDGIYGTTDDVTNFGGAQ